MFNYFNYFYHWIEENPDKVDPYITAVYFALLNRANKSGWKDKFAIILVDLQETCGINSRTTMLKTLARLEEYGFLQTVSTTTNQYKNRVICLPLNEKQMDSTWKANEKHVDITWTHNKTIKDYKDLEDYKDFIPDSAESDNQTLTTADFVNTPPPERKKVAPKKESTNHSFANSKYANNHELFIQDWNNSSGAITFPNADPIRIFETLKNASDANAKYKYSNWLSAAINWVRRNPDEYKRLHITQSGKPLHPVEQRMAETLERLNRNSLNGNADGFGHFTPPSEFGNVS
jgi:hypothetical protein